MYLFVNKPRGLTTTSNSLAEKRLKMAQDRETELGIVLVLFVIMLPIIIAMMGLIIDLGYLHYYRRVMQTASDAAAFAGAHTIKRKDFANVNANSLYDAGKNGFDLSGGETIDVNRPPTNGDFVADTDFVEVIVTEDVPIYFMRFFGMDTVAISARAVAGVIPSPGCPGCDHTEFKTSSDGTPSSRFQIWPGTYCGGISIESLSNVNFNPGTYYLKGGGLQIESGSTAEGFGVGFFNTEGGGYSYEPININSGTQARFSAQSGDGAGVMEGVLFWG